MKRATVLVMIVLGLAITARPASADQILITGGTLQMGSLSGSISLEGERGFTLGANVGVLDGFFAPWSQCFLPCAPGTSVSLAATFVGSSLHNATATLDGQSFTDVGGIASPTSAALFFTGGPVLLPAANQELITLVAPFLLTGTFNSGPFASPGFISETLSGQGTAALTLQRMLLTPDGPPLWRYASAMYTAAPIPEPATLLLTGAGLAILARRRLARGRGSEPRS